MRGKPAGPAGSHHGVVIGTAPGGSIVPVPMSQGGTPGAVEPRRHWATLNESGMSTYRMSLIWIALPLRCMRMIRRFTGGSEMCPIGSPAKNVGSRS